VEDSDGAPRPTAAADESALVAGCRQGDAASLDRFFRSYARVVERVIARVVGPTPDLEDLVQNTFISAMRGFARYRGEASLKTWITRIAIHVALRQLRGGVRRAVPLELVPAADQVLSDHELAHRLHQLLDKISPKKRVAFLLYTVEEHSIEEVAALTGAGKAATKSRIWFARRELLAMVRGRPELRELTGALGDGPWR
jgi:RNA polymerase sigma-70 factor, ECF subfamily